METHWAIVPRLKIGTVIYKDRAPDFFMFYVVR